MAHEEETLRWPTKLDRAAIDKRLAEVRDAAREKQLEVLVSLFTESEDMTAAKLAANVISALSWLQQNPEHRDITMQLEMVALNLKNLK